MSISERFDLDSTFRKILRLARITQEPVEMIGRRCAMETLDAEPQRSMCRIEGVSAGGIPHEAIRFQVRGAALGGRPVAAVAQRQTFPYPPDDPDEGMRWYALLADGTAVPVHFESY